MKRNSIPGQPPRSDSKPAKPAKLPKPKKHIVTPEETLAKLNALPLKKNGNGHNGKRPTRLGAPSVYNPEYHPRIVKAHLAQGMTKDAAALAAGICLESLDHWILDEDKPDFILAIKEGLRAGEVWWTEQARANLGNPKFNAVLWMMNMSNRFGWRRKDDVAVTQQGTVVHEIKFEHDADRASEVARILAESGAIGSCGRTDQGDDTTLQ